MRLLITGGQGVLGTELKKYLDGDYPTEEAFNITRFFDVPPCDMVVHMAAYTAVDKAEIERWKCFHVNVKGTYLMLEHYPDKPFVFISTEHAEAKGVYFESKLVGEKLVKNLSSSYLIIRTLFKPNPWPWEYAFTDQMTQGDYVDVIAPLIAKEILQWDGTSKSVFVGTGRKSMFDLAKRTRPDVKPNSIKDLALERPNDYV
jgi:dTDP-4-dehydrorhamnose reductase